VIEARLAPLEQAHDVAAVPENYQSRDQQAKS
jgi:hypothetical protein